MQSKKRESEAQVPASKGVRELGLPLSGNVSKVPIWWVGQCHAFQEVCICVLRLLYKVPQTRCLKTTETYCLTVPEV